MRGDKRSGSYRTSYEISRKLEAFYSEGDVELGVENESLYTIFNEEINVLNIKTGDSERLICGIGRITCLALAPDGVSLACAARSSLITLWNIRERVKIRDWKAQNSTILTMRFNSTSEFLAVACSDGGIMIWDVVRNYCTHNLRGHSGIVTCVRFHPDPTTAMFASCSNDASVRLWCLKTGKGVILSEHRSTVVDLAFTSCGSMLLSGGRDNIVVIWDLKTRKKKGALISHDTFESIVVIPSSSSMYENSPYNHSRRPLICTLGASGTIRIWDISEKCLIRELYQDNPLRIARLCVSISEKYLISASIEQDISLHKFDWDLSKICVKSGSPVDILSIAPLSDHVPDYISVATSSNLLRIYNTRTKECSILPGHSSVIMCVIADTRSGMIATGGRDDKVLIWKYEINDREGEEGCNGIKYSLYASCSGHTDTVNALSWGNKFHNVLLSAGADCTVKSWKLMPSDDINKEPHKLSANYTIIAHEKEVQGIDVSNKEKTFVTASSDKTAKLWDFKTGELLGIFKGHSRGIWCAKFSATGRLVATGSADKTIRLWNVSDFTCISTFEGHLNSVVDILFMSRESQIASCGTDGLIKIWDIRSSSCQKTLEDHEDRVWTLSTIKDGEFLISGSSDESIFIWRDITQEEESIKIKQREDSILLEQNLSNLMHQKNYLASIRLLLHLDHQANSFKVLRQIIESTNGEGQFSSSTQLREVILGLTDNELSRLISYCRDWNTNWRYIHVAQKLLNYIVTSVPPDRISGLKNVTDILTTLKNYSELHYKSVDDLHTRLYLLDYLIGKSVGFELQTNSEYKLPHTSQISQIPEDQI